MARALREPKRTVRLPYLDTEVLLHELAHLRVMNHGKDFMLFLNEIFAYAAKIGVFEEKAGQSLENEIPSPWPWEREIFRTFGAATEESLLEILREHRLATTKDAAAETFPSASRPGSSSKGAGSTDRQTTSEEGAASATPKAHFIPSPPDQTGGGGSL